MKVFKTVKELKDTIQELKDLGKTIGFVPTMGYLHEGHLSLVRAAKKATDIVVVSIFVNPAQFSANEDLDKYPRDIERDKKILQKENTDVLFFPSVQEMYPEGVGEKYIEVPELGGKLCGRTRPTHFRGVTTVVAKLFEMVQPDKVFFGEKDRQQLIIIKKMVQLLNLPIKIIGCPIVREKDGLARSSRNTYLSESERKAALVLFKAINKAKDYIKKENFNVINSKKVIKIMEELISSEPLARIDYVEIVNNNNLDPVDKIEQGNLVALAVYIGKTRLIDNWVVGE